MKRVNYLYVFLLISLTVITSCGKDDDQSKSSTDYSDILQNAGENVILKTYEDLATKSQLLYQACIDLQNNPTVVHLEAARAAWVATRSPWEQAEGFLFGPVDQEGIDPSIDSWPVNVVDLNNVLASTNALTIDFLSQQEGTLKGFHTIEFLLWGENSQKAVTSFNTREFEYLSASAGVLMNDTQKLYDLWKPTGGNFIQHLLKAGNGSLIYISQKSALEEMTNALIIIADEVGNGKINDPFSQKDLTLEESRFSSNSKADFANNIRSIQNIYTGRFGQWGNGKSISEIIAEKNPAMNTNVIKQINGTIELIENLPGSFSDAVFNHPSNVETCQISVRNLQKTLEQSVLPIISNL